MWWFAAVFAVVGCVSESGFAPAEETERVEVAGIVPPGEPVEPEVWVTVDVDRLELGPAPRGGLEGSYGVTVGAPWEGAQFHSSLVADGIEGELAQPTAAAYGFEEGVELPMRVFIDLTHPALIDGDYGVLHCRLGSLTATVRQVDGPGELSVNAEVMLVLADEPC